MFLYVAIVFFILSMTPLFFYDNSDVSMGLTLKSVVLTLFGCCSLILGIVFFVQDKESKNKDYAYFLKYEYDEKNLVHEKCHKDFLDLNNKISFQDFKMMSCITDGENITKQKEKEKEKMLAEQERAKMNNK